jgi:hypothetical protein
MQIIHDGKYQRRKVKSHFLEAKYLNHIILNAIGEIYNQLLEASFSFEVVDKSILKEVKNVDFMYLPSLA